MPAIAKKKQIAEVLGKKEKVFVLPRHRRTTIDEESEFCLRGAGRRLIEREKVSGVKEEGGVFNNRKAPGEFQENGIIDEKGKARKLLKSTPWVGFPGLQKKRGGAQKFQPREKAA